MTARRLLLALASSAVAASMAVWGGADAYGQAAGRGTIKGHVRLAGKEPGNVIIRMGMDPMCAKANAGKRIVQESVAAALDGSLANVFAVVQGTFPQTPVPAEAVTVDQSGCMYAPRMTGVRVGQVLRVKNSDDFLHNVHALSDHDNGFNVGQPKAGIVQQFKLKNEEIVLRLKCDVHSWMTAFVGVVSHPYFAVSGRDGVFQIANVPAGTQTVRIWQERYGVLTATVQVKAGATSTVEFSYTGNEKPPSAADLQDISLPPGERSLVIGPRAD